VLLTDLSCCELLLIVDEKVVGHCQAVSSTALELAVLLSLSLRCAANADN